MNFSLSVIAIAIGAALLMVVVPIAIALRWSAGIAYRDGQLWHIDDLQNGLSYQEALSMNEQMIDNIRQVLVNGTYDALQRIQVLLASSPDYQQFLSLGGCIVVEYESASRHITLRATLRHLQQTALVSESDLIQSQDIVPMIARLCLQLAANLTHIYVNGNDMLDAANGLLDEQARPHDLYRIPPQELPLHFNEPCVIETMDGSETFTTSGEPLPEMTPEAIERMRLAVERATERFSRSLDAYAQETAERAAALETSFAFLREHLNEEQRACFDQHDYFYVRGGSTLRLYRVRKAAQMNIDEMRGDKVVRSYCVVSAEPDIPLGDQMLMQVLMLEHDEPQFLLTANVFYPQRHRYGSILNEQEYWEHGIITGS